MALVAVLLRQSSMSSVQSSEVVCLPQEPQTCNEAQDLLLLQDYMHRLTNTLRTLEDTHAVLQQTELLADLSTSKTAETFAQPAVA